MHVDYMYACTGFKNYIGMSIIIIHASGFHNIIQGARGGGGSGSGKLPPLIFQLPPPPPPRNIISVGLEIFAVMSDFCSLGHLQK